MDTVVPAREETAGAVAKRIDPVDGDRFRLVLSSSATPDGVGELGIAATLYAPAELDEQDVRVLICWPGGSYGRDYWDIHLPGRDGYSFAEHMTARGFVVIAADPLGVGDSGRPEDGTLCTYEALADAAHGAVQLVRARLTDGTWSQTSRPSPLRKSSESVTRSAAGWWCSSRRGGAATTPSPFSVHAWSEGSCGFERRRRRTARHGRRAGEGLLGRSVGRALRARR